MIFRTGFTLLAAGACFCAASVAPAAGKGAGGAIQPWPRNPWYWQYHGKPVLLVGGSDDDNLFQWPAKKLDAELDALAAVGGNYIRNTMSDRLDKGFEVHAFKKLANGKYDLNQWNPTYWRRFEHLLEAAEARGIIVQIELWDRFDHTDVGGCNNWQRDPYNPANNVNYTYAQSGFARRYPEHPGLNKQPFFFTTPNLRDNRVVFPYQKRFVDKVLSYTLRHDNVLYCMDNETSGAAGWGAFWAKYVKQRAADAGKRVYATEMWDAWDLHSPQHRRTFDHPELYDFVDVSQNNQMKGQRHWDNFLWARHYLSRRPRPMNTVKTYGADTYHFGRTQDGLDRFWQHILAGVAAARFHRPPAGLGLSATAQASIRSVRKLERVVKLWEVHPANELLRDRAADEAYLAVAPGKAYVLYFPRNGSVRLDLRKAAGNWRLRWLDILHGDWRGRAATVAGGGWRPVNAPGKGHWLAVITPR